MKLKKILFNLTLVIILPSCSNYEIVYAKWPNGNTKSQREFVSKKLHGRVIEWNESGQKISELFYSEGEKEGLARYWDNEGNLIRETEFVKGKLISNIEFNKNNTVSTKEVYINDSLNIEKAWWSSNPKYEICYKNGVENNKWVYWYKNGNKEKEGYYQYYKAEDTLTNKYENGIGLSSSVYKKPKNGKWTYWYENGNLMREENYSIKGLKEGAWKYYNEEGNIIKEENYAKDKLVDSKEYK